MRKTLTALFAIALSVATVPALAAVDSFLKIDGIQGESLKEGHQGWIEVSSFSLGSAGSAGARRGASQATTGGAARAQLTSATFTRHVDKASVLLSQATTTGKHFQTVTLELT